MVFQSFSKFPHFLNQVSFTLPVFFIIQVIDIFLGVELRENPIDILGSLTSMIGNVEAHKLGRHIVICRYNCLDEMFVD